MRAVALQANIRLMTDRLCVSISRFFKLYSWFAVRNPQQCKIYALKSTHNARISKIPRFSCYILPEGFFVYFSKKKSLNLAPKKIISLTLKPRTYAQDALVRSSFGKLAAPACARRRDKFACYRRGHRMSRWVKQQIEYQPIFSKNLEKMTSDHSICSRCECGSERLVSNNANNTTHYVKLGTKWCESSKRNYYIISSRVIIKAIIIIEHWRISGRDSNHTCASCQRNLEECGVSEIRGGYRETDSLSSAGCIGNTDGNSIANL